MKRREHKELFDQAFHVFWKKPKMLEQLMQLMFQQITRAAGEKPKNPGFRRLAEAMFERTKPKAGGRKNRKPWNLTRRSPLPPTSLRAKDFEQMTLTEQMQARKAIALLRMQRREMRTRRFQPDFAGERIDMRRTCGNRCVRAAT